MGIVAGMTVAALTAVDVPETNGRAAEPIAAAAWAAPEKAAVVGLLWFMPSISIVIPGAEKRKWTAFPYVRILSVGVST